MLEIFNRMGCTQDTHSSTQGALWYVKYKSEGVHSQGTKKKAVSITYSMGQLVWYTGTTFKENPTCFFGFHIIHSEKQGSGVTASSELEA